MDLAVVGAGRVGTALAVLWRRAGHTIRAVSGGPATPERAARHLPGVPVLDNVAAARGAGVVVIATPDGAIAGVCEELARGSAVGPGIFVGHASGAVGLDALASARSAGSPTFAIHPLQACPTVEAAVERIPGAGFAVTSDGEDGFALGARLAEDAGGRPFRLADEAKPLYHAAAVFASNYLVAVTAIAHDLFGLATDAGDAAAMIGPLQEATLANVTRDGPATALTGPAVRGDALTVERNLRALAERAPEAVRPYVALADLALELAERSGRLPSTGREAVEEVLDRWR
jgi:predicted short-subunit dehydrogenase-like oxidoreductase (DUF2520 family)